MERVAEHIMKTFYILSMVLLLLIIEPRIIYSYLIALLSLFLPLKYTVCSLLVIGTGVYILLNDPIPALLFLTIAVCHRKINDKIALCLHMLVYTSTVMLKAVYMDPQVVLCIAFFTSPYILFRLGKDLERVVRSLSLALLVAAAIYSLRFLGSVVKDLLVYGAIAIFILSVLSYVEDRIHSITKEVL